MKYIVMIEVGYYTDDVHEGEYSGIYHATEGEAIEEMQEAWSELTYAVDVNLYIKEI